MKETTPSLTTHQKMVLMTFVQQGLFSPELAADLVVNPRPMLRSARLSEEDIDNIADFLDTVDGFNRGGSSGDASTALDVDVSGIDAEVESAILTDVQIEKLTEIIDNALDSTAAIQTLISSPKEVLTAAGLSEDDLKNIAYYIKVIQDVIEVDRSDDWI